MKAKRNGYLASKGEHFSYGLYFFGQNFLWGLAGLVTTFLTDIGIGATVAAIVLLVPKIWDAINDTLFGIIVDKIKFKNGQKFLPWVKIGSLVVGIVTILMFAIPSSLSTGWKIATFIITYLLFDAAYTMLDAPVFALPTSTTTNIQERTSLLSKGRFGAMFGGIIALVVIPKIRPSLGWFKTAIVVVVVSIILMLPLIFAGKERHSVEAQKAESISFKQMWKYLRTNKYLLVINVVMLIIGISTVQQQLSLYVARICFGDEGFASIMAVIIAVPVLIVSAIIPLLSKKLDKFTIFVGGLILAVIVSVAQFFIGFGNKTLTVALMAVSCIGLATYQVVGYMFVADCVEYGTYKTGTRAAGISFSLQTFVSKLKGALVASIALFVLGMVGFVSGEGAVQPDGMAQSVWGVYTLFPAIGYTVAVLLMFFFYKLRDKQVQVMAMYNSGEVSLQEAEESLGEKYGAGAPHEENYIEE